MLPKLCHSKCKHPFPRTSLTCWFQSILRLEKRWHNKSRIVLPQVVECATDFPSLVYGYRASAQYFYSPLFHTQFCTTSNHVHITPEAYKRPREKNLLIQSFVHVEKLGQIGKSLSVNHLFKTTPVKYISSFCKATIISFNKRQCCTHSLVQAKPEDNETLWFFILVSVFRGQDHFVKIIKIPTPLHIFFFPPDWFCQD